MLLSDSLAVYAMAELCTRNAKCGGILQAKNTPTRAVAVKMACSVTALSCLLYQLHLHACFSTKEIMYITDLRTTVRSAAQDCLFADQPVFENICFFRRNTYYGGEKIGTF